MPLLFRVRLGKTGNSVKLTIPKPILEGFGWEEGDEIEILVSDFDIALRKAKRKPGKK
ncbi:MAG: AbrB/MazE/SpoVT family DNA-binding domain-containing protein [Thaumarchaeota archaeon]|nr:AbrB/MazE/SpoVT family DNA-binding domain-containing protein [Nitrososphaerota archaeon]